MKSLQENKFWNEKLNNLSPYIPGEQPDPDDEIIKLNTNENPYPPTDSIVDLLEDIDIMRLALYPQSDWSELRQVLSQTYSIPADQIFCGNGSDEILTLIFRSFFNPGDVVLLPYPNYSLYETLAQSNDVQFEYVQSGDNFEINLNELLNRPSKAVFFSNPNAPTGKLYTLDVIKDFCSKYDGLFILDEAYIDFASENAGKELSGITLLNELDNLIVVRTFSKSFSLAGIRSGYAFSSKGLIEGLMRMKDSYNLDYISQQISIKALEDYDIMLENAERIIENRQFLSDELFHLGFDLLNSKANFLFTKHKNHSGEDLVKKLKEKKIFVRHFKQERLNEYIRITIGQREDMETLIDKLKEII